MSGRKQWNKQAATSSFLDKKPPQSLVQQGLEDSTAVENYLLYQVRNESYCVFDADEVRSGTYLCTFERSKLLDYLPRAIDVQLIPDGTDAPASWKHYGIYTQNQIIDIVAPSEPTVRTSF